NIGCVQNTTVMGSGLSVLWCPSDAGVLASKTIPDGGLPDPGTARVYYTSYAGNSGIWQYWFQQDPRPQQRMNGLFHIDSAIRPAAIADGLSNTLLLGERAHTLLDEDSALWWHWWTSGNYGDTLFCTLWPMNPHRRTKELGAGDARTS